MGTSSRGPLAGRVELVPEPVVAAEEVVADRDHVVERAGKREEQNDSEEHTDNELGMVFYCATNHLPLDIAGGFAVGVLAGQAANAVVARWSGAER